MDRRLLFFPAAAVTCWAQQTTPAAEESKQALIGRVQEYYRLMVDKKYRQAEAMVAEESKEDYYNGKKPDIKGFDVMAVNLGPANDTATVTIKAKVRVLMMGAGAQVFDMATPTHWKIENGLWCWYVPEEVKRSTPFGRIKTGGDSGGGNPNLMDGKGKAPSLEALLGQVSIDRQAVALTSDKTEQTATVTNGLPGPLDLQLDPHVASIKGLTVKISRSHLEAGEHADILLHWDGSTEIADVVRVTAVPVNRALDIRITAR